MKKYVWTLILVVFSAPSFAQNLGQYDARSLALGGTGVASANSANAAAHNPALLARPMKHNFRFIPFAVSAQAIDDDFIESIEDLDDDLSGNNTGLEDLIDRLSNLTVANECSGGVSTNVPCVQNSDLALAGSKALSVEATLNRLNQSSATVTLGAGAALSLGTEQKHVALMFDTIANLNLRVLLAQEDINDLNLYATTIEDGTLSSDEIVNLSQAGLTTLSGGNLTFEENDYNTHISVIGAAGSELGIGLADTFVIEDTEVAIGFVPKIINVTSFKYVRIADGDTNGDGEVDDLDEELDADTLKDYKAEESDLNMDIGIAFSPNSIPQMDVGVVIKNIFSQSYALPESTYEINAIGTADAAIADSITDQLKIESQVTAGVAYRFRFATLMADLDLNDAQVLGRTSQKLSLGAEFAVPLLRLQVGYQSELGDADDEDTVSAGFRLGFLDAAAFTASNKVGGVIQTSFAF